MTWLTKGSARHQSNQDNQDNEVAQATGHLLPAHTHTHTRGDISPAAGAADQTNSKYFASCCALSHGTSVLLVLVVLSVLAVPSVAAVHLAVCIKCHSGSQFALGSLSLFQQDDALADADADADDENKRTHARLPPTPLLTPPLELPLSSRPLVRSFARQTHSQRALHTFQLVRTSLRQRHHRIPCNHQIVCRPNWVYRFRHR